MNSQKGHTISNKVIERKRKFLQLGITLLDKMDDLEMTFTERMKFHVDHLDSLLREQINFERLLEKK